MTNNQAEYIRANYKKMTDQQLADKLGITVVSVLDWRLRKCLMKKKQTKWTPEETAIVHANMQTNINELCKLLASLLPNRRRNQVRQKRHYLKNRPSKHQTSTEQPRAVLDWTKWRPSVIPVQFDDGLKQAVKLQSMLMALGVR